MYLQIFIARQSLLEKEIKFRTWKQREQHIVSIAFNPQANRWRQLSNGPGQDVGKVRYVKALVCNKRRNSDCHSNLGVVRRMLLYIQPQSLICRMEINKVGKLKNPGDARPFAHAVANAAVVNSDTM